MNKFKGTIQSANFEENSITVEMDEKIRVSAGEYFVIPHKDYQEPEMFALLCRMYNSALFIHHFPETRKEIEKIINERNSIHDGE
jgi:hypothetical protein